MLAADGRDDLVAGLARPSFVDALHADLAAMATTLAPTIGVIARRVGVLADTHCVSPDGSDLPVDVLEALGGCDLILHCGDVSSLGTLDRLATLAPVLSVRSAIDPPADGVRVHEGPLIVRAGHTLIGMSTDLPDLMEPSDLFGTDVDIALTGTSHVPHGHPSRVDGAREPRQSDHSAVDVRPDHRDHRSRWSTVDGPDRPPPEETTMNTPTAGEPGQDVSASRPTTVGLIADTHCTQADGSDLPEVATEALRRLRSDRPPRRSDLGGRARSLGRRRRRGHRHPQPVP